jgi:hypothetical protein
MSGMELLELVDGLLVADLLVRVPQRVHRVEYTAAVAHDRLHNETRFPAAVETGNYRKWLSAT